MSEFTWEEMTVLEQMQCQHWDMYKDAYGVRPHWIDTSSWTEDDFVAEFEQLQEAIRVSEERRKLEESYAVKAFEKKVIEVINTGAGDRETALRWIMDSTICNGDWEFMCYEFGLPYGYFEKTM